MLCRIEDWAALDERLLAIPFAFHNETVKRIENFEGVKKYYYKNHGHGITDYEKIDMGKFINDTLNENSGCYLILNTIFKLIFVFILYI